MNKNFGIMQGRLLPKFQGRYQAHPLGYWEKEFPIASKLGLDSIEFILDFNNAEDNPLLAPGGIESIQKAEQTSGIKVRSICADYFMEAPIHSDNTITVNKSIIPNFSSRFYNIEKYSGGQILIQDHFFFSKESPPLGLISSSLKNLIYDFVSTNTGLSYLSTNLGVYVFDNKKKPFKIYQFFR